MELPDDNPKTAFGVRKAALHAIPSTALFQMGRAMMQGKQKYGLVNWREKRVSSSVYFDAAMRHLWSWWEGEGIDLESDCPHLAHVMANAAILLDAQALGTLRDDRPAYQAPIREFLKSLEREGVL